MICFDGDLKKEGKKYLIIGGFKIVIPVALLSFIIGIIIFIFSNDLMAYAFAIIFFIAGLFWLAFPFFSFENFYPKRIEIEDDIIEYYDKKGHSSSLSIDRIKKIVDLEDYYIIYCSNTIPSSVCQKDLITEGTIEEFESLFADKIIRK